MPSKKKTSKSSTKKNDSKVRTPSSPASKSKRKKSKASSKESTSNDNVKKKTSSRKSRPSTTSSAGSAGASKKSASNNQKSSKSVKPSKTICYSISDTSTGVIQNKSAQKNATASNKEYMEQQFNEFRKRLHKIDSECRHQVEKETQILDKKEQEECNRIRQQYTIKHENEIKEIQNKFKEKIEALSKEIQDQQNSEMNELKKEEESFNEEVEKKRIELEKTIETRLEETNGDIERYRKKRYKDLEEQIKRLKEQCEFDIKEYSNKRLETNTELVEQIRQRLDLEIKNELQKAKLDFTLKIESIKETYQTKQQEETKKLNEKMQTSLTECRGREEGELNNMLNEVRKQYQNEGEKVKIKIEENYKEERLQLDKQLLNMEQEMKDKLKQEQREIERRTRTKKELLQVLNMNTVHRITDEEFLVSRFHYKILRNNIILHSNCSTIYEAKVENENLDCLCKVTMYNRWSTRHKNDFIKHGTKIARYVSQFSPKMPFVKVYDLLSTDSKLYTFMLPLPSSKTLETYLMHHNNNNISNSSSTNNNVSKRSSPTSMKTVTFKKSEVCAILTQITQGAKFLNNMFIAHMSLTPDNITMWESDTDGSYHVVLTGLTRPIIYYNVESDTFSSEPGFDPGLETTIEHLPPECFEPEFTAKSVDVYSIGCLLFYLVRYRSPFDKFTSLKKMLANKCQKSITIDDCDDPALQSLQQLLTTPEPYKRIPLDDVLMHAYFNKK